MNLDMQHPSEVIAIRIYYYEWKIHGMQMTFPKPSSQTTQLVRDTIALQLKRDH